MASLGFSGLQNVRVGKTVAFEWPVVDNPENRTAVDRICRDLLSNPVIEDYRYEIS